MNYFSTIITCMVILSSMAVAQESRSSSGGKKYKGKTFRIVCWSDWTKDEIFIRNPKKGSKGMIPLDVRNMRYSKPYPYSAGKPLMFYKKTEDAEKPYALLLKVTIPQTVKKPLVMLVLNKEELKHSIYDLDDRKFSYGSYKVVNFTSVNLIGDFGGQKFLLKPQKNCYIQPNHGLEKKAIPCRVGVKQGSKTKLVYSKMIMNRSYKRMLMFFYPSKDEVGRTVIRSRSIVDFYKKPTSG